MAVHKGQSLLAGLLVDMGVRETSLLALQKIRDKLPPDKQAVFDVLLELGPTHDLRILEYLNQREALKRRRLRRIWKINQVTGRRNELVGLGVVIDLGPHRGLWGGQEKTYHLWAAKSDTRKPAGWVPVPQKALPSQKRPFADRKRHLQAIKDSTEKKVLQQLAVSDAGRTLVIHRLQKPRKETGQLVLFG